MNKKPEIVYLRGRKPKENVVVFPEVEKTLKRPIGEYVDGHRGITKRRANMMISKVRQIG